MTRIKAFVLAIFFLINGLALPAVAQQSAVIATVNDVPVTSFDIDQRINLMRLLGESNSGSRKQVANALIDDQIKISEAKKYKLNPTDKDVDDRLASIAKSLKTDMGGLKAKLGSQGISVDALRLFANAQMSLGRLITVKYREKVDVNPADVDKKLASVKAEIDGRVAKVMADPRRQPVTVYSILEINLPVENTDPQLMQSRAVEGGQIVQKFKGCASAKSAATGIFNVQVGKTIEADARKLPPALKAAFDKQGMGKAVGPVRGPKGIQVLAFCGKRTITPPKLNVQYPNRQQIENLALNEKFKAVEDKYSAILRKTAVVEYKDASYAP